MKHTTPRYVWRLLLAALLLGGCTHDLDSVSLPCADGKCPSGSRCEKGRCVPGTQDSTLAEPRAELGPDGPAADLGADLVKPDLPADSGKPDVAVADLPAPDKLVADKLLVDSSSVDTSLPDTSLPDTSLPDTAAPDMTLPDAKVDATAVDAGCTGCTIKGQCHAPKTPKGTCLICDPAYSKSLWAPAPGCMITLAGSGVGFKDGPWSAAKFKSPSGLELDGKGGLLVADTLNSCIRKVDQGTVSTVAGVCGTGGTAGGSVSTAKFHRPHDVALDGKGGILVADERNHRVRRIYNGQVTVFAGAVANAGGFVDGAAATKARLYYPNGVAVVPGGNTVYVADSNNATIRAVTMVTTSWTVSTMVWMAPNAAAGCKSTYSGMALSSMHLLTWPMDMVLDKAGDLYVVDRGCGTVRKIDTYSSKIYNITSKLNKPQDLVRDSAGVIYVADSGNNRVVMVKGKSPGATVTTLVGHMGSGDAEGLLKTQAKLTEPMGLALDGNGYLYVSDWKTSKISVINLAP